MRSDDSVTQTCRKAFKPFSPGRHPRSPDGVRPHEGPKCESTSSPHSSRCSSPPPPRPHWPCERRHGAVSTVPAKRKFQGQISLLAPAPGGALYVLDAGALKLLTRDGSRVRSCLQSASHPWECCPTPRTAYSSQSTAVARSCTSLRRPRVRRRKHTRTLGTVGRSESRQRRPPDPRVLDIECRARPSSAGARPCRGVPVKQRLTPAGSTPDGVHCTLPIYRSTPDTSPRSTRCRHA